MPEDSTTDIPSDPDVVDRSKPVASTSELKGTSSTLATLESKTVHSTVIKASDYENDFIPDEIVDVVCKNDVMTCILKEKGSEQVREMSMSDTNKRYAALLVDYYLSSTAQVPLENK